MSISLMIGADHAGFELKERLKKKIEQMGIRYQDVGTFAPDSVDYPDFGHPVAAAVASGAAERGLLVCGSGQGMVMTANRHRGVRAALPFDEETARLCREHNDANVLTLGGRALNPELAERIFEIWWKTPFAGGRHERRIRKIDEFSGP